MSLQYLRQYRLEIQTQATTPAPVVETQSDLFIITDLRIKFQITKSRTGDPNIARIDIFNLSPVNRTKIQSEFLKVTLNLGYGTVENLKLAFKGDIRNVTHVKQGVDNITSIFAGDGNKDFLESYTNVGFNNGAKAEDQVRRVIQDFTGLTPGDLKGLDTAEQNVLGITYSAPTSQVMDMLADNFGFLWSIQDERVETIPKGGSNERTAAVITAATGLISSPEVTEIGANVLVLLNPEIKPNTLIDIKSVGQDVTIGNLFFERARRTEAEGVYVVNKVVHTGDTRSNAWTSLVTGATTSRQAIT